jgi:hypothetical protein
MFLELLHAARQRNRQTGRHGEANRSIFSGVCYKRAEKPQKVCHCIQ